MKSLLKYLIGVLVAMMMLLPAACMEQSETPDNPEPEMTLEILGPEGDAFPYMDEAKAYLLAGEEANVSQYIKNTMNPNVDIRIGWECSEEEVNGFTVEYSTNSDFSHAVVVKANGNATEIGLNNLFKGTKYYVRVTAAIENGESLFAESSFTTTAVGPRVMTIDGICNVRDLGGYLTESGKTTVQGRLYRGGSLTPYYDFPGVELTEEGKIYMSETLGIKLDMDFRDLAQNNNLTESAIPDAHLEYFTIDGYSSAFSAAYKENYRRIFSALADERNYPVYMHCTGGADRTGTVAFLLNALLGVPEAELIHDYEFTSFSVYGERNSKTGIYAPYFKSLREGLAKYKGENLSEKAETYLLSIGVTELEISNIKAIMFGESLEAAIEPQTRFNSNLDESYSISILGNMDVKSITIGGKAVEFVLEGNRVLVMADKMPADLAVGTVNGVCTIGDKEYPFSFDYQEVSIEVQKTFNPHVHASLWIGIFGGKEGAEVDSLTIADTAVEFTTVVGGIRVAADKIPVGLANGLVGGVCTISGVDYGFTFEYDSIRRVSGLDFDGEKITFDANNLMAVGSDIVGYDDTLVEFHVDEHIMKDGAGDIYFMIGSYGVRFRGGCFRMSVRNADGSFGELSPRIQFNFSSIENVTLGMSLNGKNDTTVTLTLYLNGKAVYTYDFVRILAEIPSDEANMTVTIIENGTSKLVLSE